ncbi:hypothetical protein EXD76_03595, partial [BEV proteobacterium]|nr:hypothetical protein [Candidatus Symbiopectobacterium sp. Chty_BC]
FSPFMMCRYLCAKGAQYWPDHYHERNHAVANQRMSGSNDTWKKKVGHHRRSVAETAIFRALLNNR